MVLRIHLSSFWCPDPGCFPHFHADSGFVNLKLMWILDLHMAYSYLPEIAGVADICYGEVEVSLPKVGGQAEEGGAEGSRQVPAQCPVQVCAAPIQFQHIDRLVQPTSNVQRFPIYQIKDTGMPERRNTYLLHNIENGW